MSVICLYFLDVLPSSRIYLVTQSKFYQLLIVLAIHFIDKCISNACIINLGCMCRIFIAKNLELSNYSFHWINFGYFWSTININIYPNYHLHTMDFTCLDGRLTKYESIQSFELSNYSFHWINFGYFWSPMNIYIFPNYHLHAMDFTCLDGRITTYKGFKNFELSNYFFHWINFCYFCFTYSFVLRSKNNFISINAC